MGNVLAGSAADGAIGEDHDPETHLMPLVLRVAAGEATHVQIFGQDYPTPDGTCIRDFVHVRDLAAAHLLALEATADSDPSLEVYNLGSAAGFSVREVVEAARKVTGRTQVIAFTNAFHGMTLGSLSVTPVRGRPPPRPAPDGSVGSLSVTPVRGCWGCCWIWKSGGRRGASGRSTT